VGNLHGAHDGVVSAGAGGAEIGAWGLHTRDTYGPTGEEGWGDQSIGDLSSSASARDRAVLLSFPPKSLLHHRRGRWGCSLHKEVS